MQNRIFNENATFISFYKGIWTITKSHHKITGFNWATSNIMRLFGSLDIYYNKSLNTDLQKQDETQVNTFEAKGVDSMNSLDSLQNIFSIDIMFS